LTVGREGRDRAAAEEGGIESSRFEELPKSDGHAFHNGTKNANDGWARWIGYRVENQRQRMTIKPRSRTETQRQVRITRVIIRTATTPGQGTTTLVITVTEVITGTVITRTVITVIVVTTETGVITGTEDETLEIINHVITGIDETPGPVTITTVIIGIESETRQEITIHVITQSAAMITHHVEYACGQIFVHKLFLFI